MEKASSLKFIYGICAFGAGVALCGAVLPFESYPFGFAALCAGAAYTPLVFAGLCIGSLFGTNSTSLIVAYALTLVLRALVSLWGADGLSVGSIGKRIFCEHVSLRSVSAAVGSFGFGFYRLWKSGFLYYDLFAALISIFFSALLVLLWYGIGEKRDESSIFADVGLLSFLAAITWSLRDTGLYGASFAVAFCTVASLAMTKKRGIIFGCFTALVCGLCTSISYAPMFVFGAVAFGFFGTLSPLLGCTFSLGAALLWGYYISGLSAFGELLPSLLAGNMLFYFYSKIFFVREERNERKESEVRRNADTAISTLEEYTARAELADFKSDMSDICRGLEGMTAKRCVLDAGVLSQYIKCRIESGGKYIPESELSRRLLSALIERLGDGIGAVYVYKSYRLNVVICTDGDKVFTDKKRDIIAVSEEVCGARFDVADGDEKCILLCQSSVLTVDISGRKRNAKGEKKFCGDSFGIMKSGGSCRAVAFISDGMGSGREAARISGLCSLFLQKLFPLKAYGEGVTENIIESLNLFLCCQNKQNECSCTLDMAEIDLIQNKLTLYKCGSAPTYVFRDGTILRLRSSTVPMGIFENADIGKTQMEMLPGDVIVMISDGAFDINDEKGELAEYISQRILTHSTEQLAQAIIEYSDRAGFSDDVTAVAISIGERVFENLNM